MTFKCKIGIHSWNGCKCSECGKIRDDQHDWSNDCAKCNTCGKDRYQQYHSWSKDCEKCSKCGKTRENQHDWSRDCEKCSNCGFIRINAHNWTGKKCSKCGKIKEDNFIFKDTLPTEKRIKFSKNKQPIIYANMIFVEGGSYEMGRDWGQNNKPVHLVLVNSFYIDKYLTTVKEYQLFCKATGKSMPSPPAWGWVDHHPIINVTWFDADAYAKWIGKRLPTEAEWEFASRGGQKSNSYEFSGSPDRNAVAWFKDNSENVIHPVGLKLENELGLYDMNGNAWEWCYDWYLWNYYAQSSSENPTGPLGGNEKVLRGGGFKDDFSWVDSFTRSHMEPNERGYSVGFRCVKNH